LTLDTANQSVVIGTDISSIETVSGTGSNELTASNITNSWAINATNQGVINDGTADEVNFVNFNNLTGGTGNDDFFFSALGNVDTLIGGDGAGVDSLSARTGVINTWIFTDATSSLEQDNTAPIPDELYVGDFSGIETYITGQANEWADVSSLSGDIEVSSYLSFAGVIGNNTSSTLIGQNADSTWTISQVKDANDIDSSGINDGTYIAD
ncbi:hypothetical protein CXF85_00055, partial [Colwellia sp. 75C3]|uniref:hypothetical protein n=1 Tax=Colwellia sp. 75C3 TaxID=888425 RepID=UPI000CA8100F